MVIASRADHDRFVQADLAAADVPRWTLSERLRKPEVHYVLLLRRLELQLARRGVVARLHRSYARWRLLRMSVRLGVTIPPNVFGPGLAIAHYGSIVVNSRARVGSFCRIHSATNIGLGPTGVPTIGDFVYIGPGAVLYGDITVGDRAVIGANAVVGHDVPEGVTVAGAPARVISAADSASVMPAFVPVPRPAAR